MKEDIVHFYVPQTKVPFYMEMAGISYCDGTYRMKRQESAETVLEYVVEGRGYLNVDGENYAATKGDVYILCKKTTHEKAFWAPYGVRTLSKYEKMYVVKLSGNPPCWLGPIWGISNYMVFRGLVKYGFLDEAKMLAEKTVKLLETDLINSGELHEYYDPEKGTPIINPGFQNWNLLSLNMLAWLKDENVVEEF